MIEAHLAKHEDKKPPNEFQDRKGKFKKGNPGGPGNPYVRFAMRLKKEFYTHVDKHPRTVARIFNRLLYEASIGDPKAQKLFFELGMGKPRPEPRLEPAEQDVDETVKTAQARLIALLNETPKPVTKLTEALIEDAKHLVIAGLPQDGVADALGVPLDLWENWIDKAAKDKTNTLERQLVMRMRQGLAVHRGYLTMQAIKSVSGSMRMLERRDPDTFGEGAEGDADLYTPDDRFA